MTREQKLKLTLAAGLVVAVILTFALAWLAREVLRGETQHFDAHVRTVIHEHAGPYLTRAMVAATIMGEPYALWPAVGLVFVLFYRAGRVRTAQLFAVAMGGALVLEVALKELFRRPRPESFFHYPLPTSYSFPSGHALFAVAFYGTVAALVSPLLKKMYLRILLWAAVAILVAAIGYSRIYLGVHYPTDVIAGYAAALIWVIAVAIGNHVRQRRVKRT